LAARCQACIDFEPRTLTEYRTRTPTREAWDRRPLVQKCQRLRQLSSYLDIGQMARVSCDTSYNEPRGSPFNPGLSQVSLTVSRAGSTAEL
jgi:hypothetical protein